MPVNEGSKYTNFSNVEIGTSSGGGGLKVGGLQRDSGIVTVADENTTLLAANHAKPHLVANVSADRTFTLPSPSAGLEIELYANAVVADGHDWIIDTGSDTNYFTGGVVHLDADSGISADEIVPVRPDGDSNSKLQINVPDVGTRIKFISDGTLWNVSGFVVSATAPAFSDQA